MDVHLSECEQSSVHTKVAGPSRDRPHPAAQCKADILDPGAGSHSSAAPSSLTRGGSGLVALSGFDRKHSPYFSNFPFLTTDVSDFQKNCAFAHRFLEHKRLYSSPSDLYRQYNCHQVLFLFCWTTVIRETRINKRIQTLFFLLIQRRCDFHKNVAELWLFGSMCSINIINDGRLWPY